MLCTKVCRYPERTYHPERVLHPLNRVGRKGEGRFEPVSWDDALDDIAVRLKAIIARDPQAVLPYTMPAPWAWCRAKAWRPLLPQARRVSAGPHHLLECGRRGADRHLGTKVGMHVEQYADSKLILIWGSNSIASNLHFWTFAQAAKRAGAKLVCIDPRRTETADKCHEHLALMPGTDGALALGLIHELIRDDWLDHDYLDRHVHGWPALRERALQWPAERAAAVCGLPPSRSSRWRATTAPARRRPSA